LNASVAEWAEWTGWARRRRHLRRYQHVANTLAHYGFLYVVDAMGLGGLVSAGRRITAGGRGGLPDPSWPERLTQVLTALGATFVKLGQLASTRTDVLPPAVVAALERLQDQVPPVPFVAVQNTLRTAWGQDPDTVVALDPEPLAAASIGQVHRGTLIDGTAVVVKVRRPGIAEQARTDFEILEGLADLLERRTPWGQEYGVKELARELVRTMQDEMDFTLEGHNTEVARQHAQNRQEVVIPEVLWTWTRPDVLMLTEVDGVKIHDADQVRAMGLDPSQVASRLVAVMYRQIFLDGFFHADPHPGNVHLTRDGRLILMDWGMVGQLSPEMRDRSTDLLLGMIRGRSDQVVDALLRLGVVTGEVDRRGLERDVERLRRRYYETALSRFRLGDALTDLFHLANRFHVRIPGEYALLAKTAVTLDGLVRRLDPEGSLVEYGRPLAGELLWSRFNPERLAGEAMDLVGDWARVARDMPHGIEHLLRRIERGEIHIVLEHKNLDSVLSHWETLVNRLGMSFLLSALIIGSALVVHRDQLDRLTALPFGEYVFLATAAMALWVLLGALRRGRL
jgi:ubiquinone biosynthesis protein